MIRARSISEPTIKDTIIHRMDPRAKIIMLVAVSFIVVALDNPETMVILFRVVLGGFIPA